MYCRSYKDFFNQLCFTFLKTRKGTEKCVRRSTKPPNWESLIWTFSTQYGKLVIKALWHNYDVRETYTKAEKVDLDLLIIILIIFAVSVYYRDLDYYQRNRVSTFTWFFLKTGLEIATKAKIWIADSLIHLQCTLVKLEFAVSCF